MVPTIYVAHIKKYKRTETGKRRYLAVKRIKILGGGIAGLTAAINLKKSGVEVEVHVRKNRCGKHTNDFQYLENWTFDEDTLELLASINIQTDFPYKPLYTQDVVGPSGKKYVGNSNIPILYVIKRGRAGDSLDRALESQALKMDVNIIHHSALKIKEADIVAIGVKKPAFIVTGIMFSCDHRDESVILFDDQLSEKFYSYFIVNDNLGEIACINPVNYKDHITRLEKTIKRFEELYSVKIEKIIERFSAPLSFDPLKQARINNQYFVGEAAGFQDCFYGFGMLYAFKSGYLAAKSIIEGLDYSQLLNREILKPIHVSVENRVLFEKLTNKGYERLITVLNSRNPIIRNFLGGNDVNHILKKLYNRSLSHFLRFMLFR
jgi:flavin-dependent dehydrogenase